MNHRVSLVVATAALMVACSSSSSTNPGIVGSNGVNDVSKACAIRTSWAHASEATCSMCMAGAAAARCTCTDRDYAGACDPQQVAMDAVPGCSDARICAAKCAAKDCTCTDACYAGKDDCHTKASALDGCLAEVCAPSCQ